MYNSEPCRTPPPHCMHSCTANCCSWRCAEHKAGVWIAASQIRSSLPVANEATNVWGMNEADSAEEEVGDEEGERRCRARSSYLSNFPLYWVRMLSGAQFPSITMWSPPPTCPKDAACFAAPRLKISDKQHVATTENCRNIKKENPKQTKSGLRGNVRRWTLNVKCCDGDLGICRRGSGSRK